MNKIFFILSLLFIIIIIILLLLLLLLLHFGQASFGLWAPLWAALV